MNGARNRTHTFYKQQILLSIVLFLSSHKTLTFIMKEFLEVLNLTMGRGSWNRGALGWQCGNQLQQKPAGIYEADSSEDFQEYGESELAICYREARPLLVNLCCSCLSF